MDLVVLNGVKVPATYLGDAVYCLFDGYSYLLRLNDHRNKEGQICLEPQVLNSLLNFVEECNKLREVIEKENAKRKESENLASTDNTQER